MRGLHFLAVIFAATMDTRKRRCMFQVSCGHDGQISSLRTNLETAEREIERLRGLVQDQQDDHEMYLTEMSTCFFTFANKSTLKCGNSVKTYASILGKLDFPSLYEARSLRGPR